MSDLAFGFLQVENVVEVSIPQPFTFNREDWPDWLAHFERYRKASKLDTSDERLQVNALLLHMGPQSARILDELQPPVPLDAYEDVVRTIDAYFHTRANVVLERARFNLRNQRENETADNYIAAVTKLAKTCNYGDLELELIRDRIVVGIRDKKCSEALQQEENLTLEKAKSIVVHAENIKKVKQATKKTRSPASRDSSCGRCGCKPNHPLGNCPAKDVKCTKCANKGHYAKCCQTNPKVIDKCKEKEKEKEKTRTTTTAQKEESFEFV